jgi:hypothetical protein
MGPALEAAIAAAEDLAWRPMANVVGLAYGDRQESATRFRERLERARLPAGAEPELRCLVEAMRRAAECSYANRMGLAYYERRRAVAELRGALIVWRRG